MGWVRAVPALVAVLAAGGLLVSGGSGVDPRTPRGLPGMPSPFLGVAVVGEGGLTAAIDAYGNVVDLRAPGPAGRALIENPAERQAAGAVPADTGIVPRVRVKGRALPMWRAEAVRQRYLPGTNVVRTVAVFDWGRVAMTAAAKGRSLAVLARVRAPAESRAVPRFEVHTEPGISCEQARSARRAWLLCGGANPPGARAEALRLVAASASENRHWLAMAEPLEGAPPWARAMYRRSLLVLRALTDSRTGAVAAGARDCWTYVWPRDAGAAALAYAAAGYRAEARRVAGFLLRLDLDAAARFHGDGSPVPGRGPQGDADGWAAVATRATGLPAPAGEVGWRDLPDYQEKEPGDHLANAIASGRGSRSAIARSKDSAVAWAVRPFSQPDLYPAAQRALRQLTAGATRFGLTPSADWPEEDPWSAPTAWTAWSLAALGERRLALQLMRALRRSVTPAGALPERVDARTGIPRSTTPLAWSHAFAILALRELWPSR